MHHIAESGDVSKLIASGHSRVEALKIVYEKKLRKRGVSIIYT